MVTTIVITRATVPEFLIKVHLAAVHIALITITKPRIAAVDMTRAEIAAGFSMFEVIAVVSTRPTVAHITCQFGLTPGDKLSIAARVSRLTCAWGAYASHAFTEDTRSAIGT